MYQALENLSKKAKELKDLIKKEGESAIKEAFKDFFDKYPEIKALQWRQYTPHYNDGETCYFSVYDLEFSLDGDEYFDGDYYAKQKGYGAVYSKMEQDFRTLKGHLFDLEDVLETVFGDHAQITVTREKIEVDEYEHD